MPSSLDRRSFVRASLVAGVAGAVGQAPAVRAAGARPVVVASSNGNRHKNGGTRTTVALAFERIAKGEDVLDALIAGVNLCELDPADDSVGYGGLPNADGVVQLDASVMHGPRRRAGAVACLEGVRTPSLVAKAVMEQTDHHLLVGAGAQLFARQMGFAVEADLNTENSRKKWLDWKRQIDPEHYLDPEKRDVAADAAREAMIADGRLDPLHVYGTINCNGVSARGEVCGVTTTSGLAWKIPGRVGDSPILGAGLWVDGEVGAAGSTGRGEANLYNLSSHLIVENLRRGMSCLDAGMDALRRIRANTVEKRLRNAQGNPAFYVNFYVVDAKGGFAGVSMYGTYKGRKVEYALCTEHGPETRPVEALIPEHP
ncbi:MAG: N(4)-(beta-N-acetylglucosaminyl)-L-asparaginase [Vicinamibacteria bacterium]|nr:N(4)-(beta-N-acetylglucosaminyl)-L-asparaginase [Vicinamibacteria bacterium]